MTFFESHKNPLPFCMGSVKYVAFASRDRRSLRSCTPSNPDADRNGHSKPRILVPRLCGIWGIHGSGASFSREGRHLTGRFLAGMEGSHEYADSYKDEDDGHDHAGNFAALLHRSEEPPDGIQVTAPDRIFQPKAGVHAARPGKKQRVSYSWHAPFGRFHGL